MNFLVYHYNAENLVDPTKGKTMTMFQWNTPMTGMETKSYVNFIDYYKRLM